MPLYANIGGAQKQPSALYANIGGAQKQSSSLLGNVGGASKELLALPQNFWVVPYSAYGTMATNTRTRMVANSVTVASDGTFTLVSATSISGRPAAGKYYVSVSTAANSSATTGTVVYYAVNASGLYYGFNATNWEASTSDPSASSSAYGDVDALRVGDTLYVNKTKISSYYRWVQSDVSYSQTSVVGDNSEVFFVASTFLRVVISYTYSGGRYILNGSVKVTQDGTAYAGYWGALVNNGNIDQLSDTIYKVSSVSNMSQTNARLYYSERKGVSPSKGEATGKYKFAKSSSAYPTNGVSVGYWYSSRTTVS